ncbi:MAG TPA: sigma-70 family RNA polymerase sigma factor [Candidatus Paceibacterota bacterium]|nr:sigma-70 family RNA polymerase sigma factor [Candidatus Paceibacterota bacterium]
MLDGEIKLVESAVRGKASAFGLLYDHYQPKIYRFVLIKVSRREDAEDITHQVFLNAWQNISNYKDLGFPFSSWLYRIAKNQIIDKYRTKKQEVDLESVDEEIFADSGISDNIEIKIRLERVMKEIKNLKQDYQDVLIMRFVEDLSIKEVAAAVEKSEGAVKLMQHRAIKELKKSLGNPIKNN